MLLLAPFGRSAATSVNFLFTLHVKEILVTRLFEDFEKMYLAEI